MGTKKNMLIAIGGAFEPKEVVAEINSLLGDWQPATTPTCRIACLEQGF